MKAIKTPPAFAFRIPIERTLAALLAAGCLFCFCAAAQASTPPIPEDTLKYPVQIAIEKNAVATGFFLNRGDSLYLVTAKHILFDGSRLAASAAMVTAFTRRSGFEERVMIAMNLELLMKNRQILANETEDVVAVRLGSLSPQSRDNLVFQDGVVIAASAAAESIVGVDSRSAARPYDQVQLAEDVYIFGYPYSIGVADFPQIDYLRPLLRKGIVAGKNKAQRTLILDCPSHYGNSGGPVLGVEKVAMGRTKYTVIGVLTEFVPFQKKLYGVPQGGGEYLVENSGYSVAAPIDGVIELIDASEGNR